MFEIPNPADNPEIKLRRQRRWRRENSLLAVSGDFIPFGRT